MDEWLELNLRHWDERARPHAESANYGADRFASDPTHLSDVVRFDLPRLGDLAGVRGVHLQCHIGTDTISLSRLGARMTGLDFSTAALAQARTIAARAGAEVEFVQSELYDAPQALGTESFDLVFTGVGALCWLPDIARWGQVVAALLRPGGRLFLREGHPIVWTLEDGRPDDVVALKYPYFEQAQPTVFDEPGSYVQTEHEFQNTTSADWNHGVGEIVTALLDAGMRITMVQEHDSVPWDALPGQMELLPSGEYRLRDRPWRLPHSYTLQAEKGQAEKG